MLNAHSFDQLTAEIEQHGFDSETAARYAALIGDTPCVDAKGNIVIRENGIVLARLQLKFYRTENVPDRLHN